MIGVGEQRQNRQFDRASHGTGDSCRQATTKNTILDHFLFEENAAKLRLLGSKWIGNMC
jgi:hypothetical protein